MDVCVEDPSLEGGSAAPTFAPTPTKAPEPTAEPTPIGSNSWGQTWGTTDTFKFVGPPSTAPPTTEEEAKEDWSWILNMTDPQPLELVGDNGKGPFPLGPCQADCDRDSDCAGPLECFQRKGGEDVPGCLGSDETDEDYCVWPEGVNITQDVSALEQELEQVEVINPWDSGFCLKLWWYVIATRRFAAFAPLYANQTRLVLN